MMKTSDASTLMHQSLRNRPSRLLYEPPAIRQGNKGLKSPAFSSNNKSKSVRCETDSKISCLPKPTECESVPICQSKPSPEQKFVANSENSPFLSCRGDLERTTEQRLQPVGAQWLSERKPAFGRGMLLKRQLLYKHKFIVPNKSNVEQERQNSQDATGGVVCAANLVKTDYQSSDDFKNSHADNPSLKASVDESTSHTNGASPQQIENNLKSFVSGNSTCEEDIPSLSIQGHDDVRYILEETVRRLEKNKVPKSFASGDWEAKTEVSESTVCDGLLPVHRKSPITQNKFYSRPDSLNPIVYDRDPDYSFSQTIYNNKPNVTNFGQPVSDGNSDPSCSQSFNIDDLKGLTNFFHIPKKADDEELVNIFNSETSSLSDETYLTVASHVSDAEENNAEDISLSADSFDRRSLLLERRSCTQRLVNDSSDDDTHSFKTSFSGDSAENTEILESLQSFQENLREQIKVSVCAREKNNHHHTDYQIQDDKFNQNTNNHFFKDQWQGVKCNTNTMYVKDPSAKCELLKLKLSSEPEKVRTPELSVVDSTYPRCLSPNSSPQNAVLYFHPSATKYKTPTSTPIWTSTAERANLKESPFSGSTSSPLFFNSFKKNVTRTLPRHISGERLHRLQRHSWSGSQSNDRLIDSLRTRLSLQNRDFWSRSVFQFQPVFADNAECSNWKMNYRKKCSEAGHRFIDTHCHIDRILSEDLDTIYGTFQEYREANADSFPTEFAGCVTIFCNPLTFNPRGSLFRSLVNEKNVWIAVGCHPKNVRFLDDRTLLYLNTCIRMPQVVAVGEIGLDYSGIFYLQAEKQKEVFRAQIKLALDVSKPIVIHCRDAEYDCFDILKMECPSDWFIHLHCYMLDFKHAQKWLNAFPNLYIGLTPRITYKSAFSVRDTAQKIPLTRLVLETDAPYFIPSMVPDRQLKCSHPGLVFSVAETVAQLQGRDINEVLRVCWDNSLTLYKIQPDA